MSFSNYETSVVINTTKLAGVTSANGSYSIEEEPYTIAGFGFVDAFLSEAPRGSFSFERKMISKDPFVYDSNNSDTFDDRSYFSGAILYGDRGFGFERGRLTSYSISCSIDQIPEISVEFDVLGDVGPHLLPEFDPTESVPVEIPSQGSIEVTCIPAGETEIFSTNHVSSFSYERRVDLEEVYALPTGTEAMWDSDEPVNLSNTFPIQVDIVDPIEIDLNFSIVINDRDAKELRDRLLNTQANSIVIDIKNPETNETINQFTAPYARLLSESVTASTDGEVTSELSFKSYINKNFYSSDPLLAQRAPMFLTDNG